MIVIVSRSGGITGMRITWQVSVDDQPDAADWRVLLRTLPWDDVAGEEPAPDRFTYRIRYEQPEPASSVDGRSREATLAERQVRGPWRELVDRVRAADADPSRGGGSGR